MPEETGQPTSPESAGTTEAPEVKFVNPDGTFVEGWQGTLTDENLRNDETLKRFTGHFEDLAKSYVNVRKQVPMDKVTLPTETSLPEVWDEFYKAIGRPETPEDYTYEIPENLKDYYDDPLVQEAKAELHKAGLTQKQAEVVMALDRKRLELGVQQMQEENEKEKAEAETALRNKWGIDYEKNVHLANRMIAENVSPENKAQFLEKFGNDPDFAEFAKSIASKFMEHKIITEVEAPSESMDDIDGKIKELQAKEGYLKKMHPDHKFIQEQLTKLYKEKSKIKSQTTS